MFTFQFHNKTYDSRTHAVNPASNRVVKQNSVRTQKLLREGHQIADAAGIPHILPIDNLEPAQRLNVEIGLFDGNNGEFKLPTEHKRQYKLDIGVWDDQRQFLKDTIAEVKQNAAPGSTVILKRANKVFAMHTTVGELTLYGLTSAISRLFDQEHESDNQHHLFYTLNGENNPVNEDAGRQLSHELLAGVKISTSRAGSGIRYLGAGFAAADAKEGFCVKECMQEVLPEENFDKLPAWCTSKDMIALSQAHELDIRVWSPAWAKVNDGAPLHRFNSNLGDKNSKAKIVNLLYQMNHCTILPFDRSLNCKKPFQTFSPNERAGAENVVVYGRAKRDDESQFDYNKMMDEEQCLLEKKMQSDVEKGEIVDSRLDKYNRVIGYASQTHKYVMWFRHHEKWPQAWSEPQAIRLTYESVAPQEDSRASLKAFRMSKPVSPPVMYNNPDIHPAKNRLEKIESYHYDQIKAYGSYAKCDYFTGFCKQGSPQLMTKYDPAFLDQKYEGAAFIYTNDIWPKTVFTSKNCWASFAELRLARDQKWNIEATICVIGKRDASDVFDGVRNALGNNKRVINTLNGVFQAHTAHDQIVVTSAGEIEAFAKAGWMSVSVDQRFAGRRAIISKMKKAEPTALDPAGVMHAIYIQGYQRISMWTDVISKLEQCGMTYENDVIRLWTDGIFLTKPIPDALMADCQHRWHPMIRKEPFQGPWMDTPVSKVFHVDGKLDEFETWRLEKYVNVVGKPGAGKSWVINNVLNKNNTCVVAAPSLMAKSILGPTAITAQKLYSLANRAGSEAEFMNLIRGKDTIVLDEGWMTDKRTVDACIDSGAQVAIFGDPQQTRTVTTDATERLTEEYIDECGFVTHNLKGQHRFTDPATIKFMDDIRYTTVKETLRIARAAGIKFIKARHYEIPAAGIKTHLIGRTNKINSIINREYLNNVADSKAVWYNKDPKYELDKKRAPMYVGQIVQCVETDKSKDKTYINQQMGFVVEVIPASEQEIPLCKNGKARKRNLPVDRAVIKLIVPNTGRPSEVKGKEGEEEYDSYEALVPTSHLVPGLAVTCCKMQGATLHHKLTVDSRGLGKDRASLYVALSRCTNIKQITIIE